VHVAWGQDERPVWLLGCVFEVRPLEGEGEGERAGGLEGRRLWRALGAMGSVREPCVVLSGGQAEVSMLVRGADEADAAHCGLSIVDVAVSQVPGLRLGELVERSVTPARSAAPGV
jgi:hypothetical protein